MDADAADLRVPRGCRWMKVSDSAEDLEQVTGGQLALMFVLGISLHIVFLVFNYTITAFIPDMRL